ncbi:MAG: TolC family protein [Rikenellaceae bacterium]|nr:TolC family protein [Rikenellaceae bacterium]
MRSLNKYIVLTALLVPVYTGFSQVMSLPDLLTVAIEQNLEIRITRNEQEIADNNYTRGNAGYLPNVNFSTGYSGTFNNQYYKEEAGDRITNRNMNSDSYNVGVNLNWTVFDGFSVQTRYEKLYELSRQGEINTMIAVEDIASSVTSAYYDLLQQKIRLRNYQYAVDLSRERLSIVELRKFTGAGSGLEVLQAQVDFNSDSAALLRQEQNIRSASIELTRLMAQSDFAEIIDISDTSIYLHRIPDIGELLDQTYEKNTSLILAESGERVAYLDYKATRSDYFPSLIFNGGYGYQFSKSDASVYKNQGTLGFNYGLTIGFNIFDGNNRSRVRKNAKIQMDNIALARENLEISIKSQLFEYWTAHRNNLLLLDLEQQNLKVAQENYRTSMERYRLEELSGIELREAQQNLLNAEDSLLAAEYNTKICEIVLMYLSGNIFQYFYR